MKRATTLLALVGMVFIMLECKQLDIVPVAKVQTISAAAGINSFKAQGKIVELISSDDEVGFCYSTNDLPTSADSKVIVASSGNEVFNALVSGLDVGTKYYIRAYAKNGSTYVYGDIIDVTTLTNDQIVIDFDLNKYAKVTIGTQVWMRENYKVTHFRNGDPIPNVTDGSAWTSLTTPAYCNYNNNPGIGSQYGALYNYYTTVDSRGLCPTGWHVPTDAEWTTLINFLGGESSAGAKMKEVGVSQDWPDPSILSLQHWQAPNTGATNESGFTAFAAGFRSEYLGSFESIGGDCFFWSSQENNAINAFYRTLSKVNTSATKGNRNKANGYSVRCIQGTDKFVPVVITGATSNMAPTSVTIAGSISSTGGSDITEQGVCLSTSTNPTILNQKVTSDLGSASYSCNFNGLVPNYTYYARAYAVNEIGVAYGNEVSFTTSNPATIMFSIIGSETSWASDIDMNYITTDGSVSYYKINSRLFKQDEEFKIRKNHEWAQGTWGYADLIFHGETSNLEARTVDNIGIKSDRIYEVTLEVMWGGNEFHLYMNNLTPSITTSNISSFGATSATCGGNVNNLGSSDVSVKGVCWSTSPMPTIALTTKSSDGTGTGAFVSNLPNLSPNTKYYIRAYATNSSGTSYGAEVNFTTASLAIGDSYQGGKVAYILQSGDPGYNATVQHGLIAALSDQSSSAAWGCAGTTIIGGDGTAIGAGLQNTIDIMAGCATAGIAARLCRGVTINGYSDWYLPSRDEMFKLYLNKDIIGGFTGNSYWTSSEFSTSNAYYVSFVYGDTPNGSKSSTVSVRAVRSF